MNGLTYELTWDGNTVWVNGSDGSNLGRFGRLGYDIHKTGAEQVETGKVCIFCTHAKTTMADWGVWRAKITEFSGLAVPDAARPKWLS